MTTKEQDELIKAKQAVRKIWWFYINLAAYIVLVSLLVYNLYIVAGPYKNNIISLNLSILVAWTVFISVHGVIVFKGRQIFKKSWEDKKINQFLKDEGKEQTTFWE